VPEPTPITDHTVYEVPVTALVAYPGNPRVSDVEALARSLTMNGQFRPLVVRKETREILGGNHTWKAATSLGWAKVKVTYVEGLTDEQAARIVLADNRYSDLASYNVPDLTALLDSLPTLDGTGYDTYTAVNLEAAFADHTTPATVSPVAAPAPEGTLTSEPRQLTGDDIMRQPRVTVCPNCSHTWEV
jgi:hypothetical protein